MKFEDIVNERLCAGFPGLYIASTENARTLQSLWNVARSAKYGLQVWTFGKGLSLYNLDGKGEPTQGPIIKETESPLAVLAFIEKSIKEAETSDMVTRRQATQQRLATTRPSDLMRDQIIVLRHFHHFMEDPQIQITLVDLLQKCKTRSIVLVVMSPVVKLPPELEKEFDFLEVPLPDEIALGEVIQGIVQRSELGPRDQPTEALRNQIVTQAKGLTTCEAENAISLAFVRGETTKQPWCPEVVQEEKCAVLKKSGLLEYVPSDGIGLDDIGGMDGLKEYMRHRQRAFTPQAKAFGIPTPKGILLVGPPGAGKSMAAKAIAKTLGVPLIRFDIARVFGSLVGQSEKQVRQALQLAETVSPCVLMIDEIEKGLAGASGANDSGVGARVLGTILTWLQEKTTQTYVLGTANNVAALPPELLRKGRWDELFSVMLPTTAEREDILKIHLRRRKREALLVTLDLRGVAQTTDGYSGAELEQVVVDAMFLAFDAGRDVSQQDLLNAAAATRPLSRTMREQLASLASWCQERTRPAALTQAQLAPGSSLDDSLTTESALGRKLKVQA